MLAAFIYAGTIVAAKKMFMRLLSEEHFYIWYNSRWCRDNYTYEAATLFQKLDAMTTVSALWVGT
jgi:hypothetical protein